MTDTNLLLIGGIMLLAIGWYGLLTSRHLLKLIAILQIMVKAILLILLAAGKINGNFSLAQSLMVYVISADTMLVVLALALAVQLYRHTGTMDILSFAKLKG